MSEGGWMCSVASVMPGLTRHPVLSMAESERTEGEKEIVVSLVRQLSWTHISALLPLKCAVYSGGENGSIMPIFMARR